MDNNQNQQSIQRCVLGIAAIMASKQGAEVDLISHYLDKIYNLAEVSKTPQQDLPVIEIEGVEYKLIPNLSMPSINWPTWKNIDGKWYRPIHDNS